jgi:3'-phosphoadenosine 5'-phosphosulfate (PAPS) 3'-phosphatase
MERLTTLNAHVCELARQAGEKIMRFYEEKATVTWKTDSSPLTTADSASHETRLSIYGKFAEVLSGGGRQADLCLRDVTTMEWDTAAAQCIVEAAGGEVGTLDSKPLRYGKPDLKNPAIMTVGDCDFNWVPPISGADWQIRW